MKKLFILIFVLLITIAAYPKVNFFIDFTGSSLKPADTGYAEIYGDKILYPEIIAGIKIFKDIYFYGGYGSLNLKGDIVEAGNGVNATSSQSFISIGLGYELMAKKKISLKVSGGIIFVNYEGKAYLSDTLIDDDSGTKTGYKVDLGLIYNFSKSFNISITAGYFHAQNTEDYYRKLSYGGLKKGIGFGIRF